MKKSDTIALIREAYERAEEVRSKLAARWDEAWRYYSGDPSIVPSVKGRSKAVMNVMRPLVRKTLRNVRRVYFGQDEIVEYLAERAEDVPAANEISDYVNLRVVPRNRLIPQLVKAMQRSILVGISPIEVRTVEQRTARTMRFTALGDAEVDALKQRWSEAEVRRDGDRVEVRVPRVERRLLIEPFPLDELLIDDEADSFADAVLIGRVQAMRRGEILDMGYDPRKVDQIIGRRPEDVDDADRMKRAIDFINLYVRVPDGQGYEALYNFVFLNDVNEDSLLEYAPAERIPFANLGGLEHPDQLVGEGLYDQVAQHQRILTAMLRQMLDNMYWANIPRPIVDLQSIANPNDLDKHDFGAPIFISPNARTDNPVQFYQVPFVAQHTFQIAQWLQSELQQQTGINDAAGGLDPNALQNLTAKAAALIEHAGIGGVEEWTRALESGFTDVFRLVLHEVLENPPEQRTMRVGDDFVPLNVAAWTDELEIRPNTGLGTGSRERDLQAVSFVLGLLEKIVAGLGPDNPFVRPENIVAAAKRAIEAAGLKTPELFINDPDPQEVQAWLQRMAQGDGKLQLEQAKMQIQAELERIKMQREQAREVAQMQADLRVREKEEEIALTKAELEAEVRKDIERAKLEMERQLKELELENNIVLEEMRAQTKKEIERMKLEAAEMQVIGEEVEAAEQEAERGDEAAAD